jgi:hypothetical protein
MLSDSVRAEIFAGASVFALGAVFFGCGFERDFERDFDRDFKLTSAWLAGPSG